MYRNKKETTEKKVEENKLVEKTRALIGAASRP